MPRDPVIAYHQHQIGDGLTQAAPPGPAARASMLTTFRTFP